MSEQQEQFTMSADELFREETFTDQKVGSIRRMTPVDNEGNDDSSRETRYYGSTQVMTQGGALPINFAFEVSTLQEAAEQFAIEAEKALEKTMEELQELRRQQQSSIMTPGQQGQGGGGIQMP